MNFVEPIRKKTDIRKVERFFRKRSFRDLVLFDFGINSGLRVSDLLNLDVCDVKNKDYVSIRELKTGKYKQFPLNRKMKKLLYRYTRHKFNQEPLFQSRWGKRLDRTYVYRSLTRACKEVGITYKVGTHTMRKTFGYHHYQMFKDIAILQKIFNHKSPETTLRYIGINQDLINRSYRQFVL